MLHSFHAPALRRAALVAMTLASLFPLETARAEEVAPSAEVSIQVQFRQAYAAFDQENWTEARRLFLDLWKRSPTYDVAAALGEVEYKLGHYGASTRFVAFAASHAPPQAKPEQVQALKDRVEELMDLVGVLRVSVNQSSAEVFVDDELVGKSPIDEDVYLDIGTHRVKARLGDEVAEQTIHVLGGNRYPVQLELTPAPSKPSQPSEPAASSPAGPATDDRTSAKPVVLWTGVGLTALAAGIGAAYFFDASAAASDVDDLKKRARDELGTNCEAGSDVTVCRALQSAVDDRNSSSDVSRVAFIASGVFLAATVTTYFAWPESRTKTAGLQPLPVMGPGTAGLALKGSF